LSDQTENGHFTSQNNSLFITFFRFSRKKKKQLASATTMQYVTDMYGIYSAIKPEKNRERESVRKRRGEKGNNTEGNTREKKK
jgi:hypothetical protein